jgi:hypothetical protein
MTAPMLTYADGPAAMDWLVRAFGSPRRPVGSTTTAGSPTVSSTPETGWS